MVPLPLFVVSQDPLVRSGLSALLAARAELKLLGEAGPRDAAKASAGALVLLWDLGPGGASGRVLDGWGELGARVLALAADAGQAGEALRAGARGVMARGAKPGEISAGAAAVAAGLLVLDPLLAARYLKPPELSEGEPLTPREQEVLLLLSEGLANKAIAARLGISEHTAKFHVNAILNKLGVESRAEAIVRAARLGLVSL
jgi:DNA-binding NarL/FixJ family response regulator